MSHKSDFMTWVISPNVVWMTLNCRAVASVGTSTHVALTGCYPPKVGGRVRTTGDDYDCPPTGKSPGLPPHGAGPISCHLLSALSLKPRLFSLCGVSHIASIFPRSWRVNGHPALCLPFPLWKVMTDYWLQLFPPFLTYVKLLAEHARARSHHVSSLSIRSWIFTTGPCVINKIHFKIIVFSLTINSCCKLTHENSH